MGSENNKIVIEEPATRYTRPTTAFTVKTQTGEERMVSVEVVPDQVAHLLEGQVSVSWARGVLTVDTPAHRVIYNGKTLDVINKVVFAAGDQCGLRRPQLPPLHGPLLQGEQRHRAVLSPVLLCRREAL